MHYKVSKNNKPSMKGVYQFCQKKKSKFLSTEAAKKGRYIFSAPALLADLGAARFLAGGAATIASAINRSKVAKKTRRINKTI